MSAMVIVDAIRTPVGRRKGWLREVHPVSLGSFALCQLLERTQVSPEHIDHVIMGCVGQAGEQTFNLARNVVLDAELPITIPATTIDFQCGSSQQAVHLAAALVGSGQADLVIAGGVESMTRVPMGSSIAGMGDPFTERIMTQYNMIPQGMAADEIAQKWGVSRDEVDDIGYESHLRAIAATEKGWLRQEMAAMEGLDEQGNPFQIERDQGIRFNARREKLTDLQPAFTPQGVTTAGNSSQISDGAAVTMVTTEAHAQKLGLKPRARIVEMATVGSDPHLMLTGPIGATHKVLARAHLAMKDIDLFEVNEAFAAVVAMWRKEMTPDMNRVNVHGGAIALGHPLGASGARLMTTLLNALDVHDKRYGLQTMCCGGGLGTGTIVERLERS